MLDMVLEMRYVKSEVGLHHSSQQPVPKSDHLNLLGVNLCLEL